MKREELIGGKKCLVYDNGSAIDILIQAIDNHDLEVLDQEFEMISEMLPEKELHCMHL